MAQAYLNHLGTTWSPVLAFLGDQIEAWPDDNLLGLAAVYLSGRENRPADQLNHQLSPSVTMCLSLLEFWEIMEKFGSPWLFLCASP